MGLPKLRVYSGAAKLDKYVPTDVNGLNGRNFFKLTILDGDLELEWTLYLYQLVYLGTDLNLR